MFREKNLHLNSRERGNKFHDDLERFLLDHRDDCGIVCCVLPTDVVTVHAELLKRGIDCVKYHGQLSEEIKIVNHSKWGMQIDCCEFLIWNGNRQKGCEICGSCSNAYKY